MALPVLRVRREQHTMLGAIRVISVSQDITRPAPGKFHATTAWLEHFLQLVDLRSVRHADLGNIRVIAVSHAQFVQMESFQSMEAVLNRVLPAIQEKPVPQMVRLA